MTSFSIDGGFPAGPLRMTDQQVSEAVIEAGVQAWHTLPEMLLDDLLREVYLAMKAKELGSIEVERVAEIDKAVDGLVILHRRLLSCFQSPTGEPLPRRPQWLEPTRADCDAALNAAVTLERIKAAVPAFMDGLREADLTLALDLACRTLGDMEPPDSRAVSNEFVAMFSILCGKANDECRDIIKAAIAEHEARTVLDTKER